MVDITTPPIIPGNKNIKRNTDAPRTFLNNAYENKILKGKTIKILIAHVIIDRPIDGNIAIPDGFKTSFHICLKLANVKLPIGSVKAKTKELALMYM